MLSTQILDRSVLGAVCLLGVGVLVWTNSRSPVVDGSIAAAMIDADESLSYQVTGAVEGLEDDKMWTTPAAQSRGSDWIYDVFTPPVIYFDPHANAFTVTSPDERKPVAPTAEFGLKLVDFRREPFRLQLVGFVGGEASCHGVFENLDTTEHFLARAGKRLADLELTIVEFEVKRVRIETRDSMTTEQRVATAQVKDERTGAIVTLTNHARAEGGIGVATVVTNDAPDRPREWRVGETLAVGDARFRLDGAQLSPLAIHVTKYAPDRVEPQRQTLTLRR